MTGPWPDRDDGPARRHLSTLRSLLVLFMLLTQQDSRENILNFVANTVESLGPGKTLGIFVDGQWQDIRGSGWERPPAPIAAAASARLTGPVSDGLRIELPGVPWSWAYSLSSPHGPPGYLVVGADSQPTDSELFLLQLLAQQAGAALANAALHSRERERATELRAANDRLARSMEVHQRLTRVALEGEGQEGLAEAVHKLTDRAVAIEDRFGNLRAWAGPGRPDPYPKDGPDQRYRFLMRMMGEEGSVRAGDRLISVAVLGGAPVGVLTLYDPDQTAGDTERMAVEHGATVLAMEIAHLQSAVENDTRLRINLVLDLIAGIGPDGTAMLNRAQALGYDIGRPHRVVIIDAARGDGDMDLFFHAVGRAARQADVGSLLAPRLQDVIVLADTEASWGEFHESLTAELRGHASRVGVGGQCREFSEFSRSYREAQLALRIQQTIGGPEQVTIFSELGVYQLLATANDTSAVEEFVQHWLGPLIDYDNLHGAQLVLTLSEYLDRGGNYDASARALSVHRSTLKYRLKRIRAVSGYDLSLPDTVFNLQLATRALRTLQALRQS